MNLPRAVIEAEKRADEILASLQQSQQQPAQDPVLPVEGAAPETPTETPVAPVEDQQTAAPQEEDQSWKSRYDVLIGKYNAEVPRLAAEKRELRSEIDTLKREVEQLKSKPQPTSLVKPEEVQEFGEPLVDLIRRAAREEVAAKDAEIASLKARLDNHETVTIKSKTESFYDDLGTTVPEWMSLNEDKAFLNWLNEYDEFAGKTRLTLLQEAEQALDAKRVAKFFLTWKQNLTNKSAAATRSLEQQVVPDASRSTSPPPARKIWTSAEIAAFYADVRGGRYSDKDAAAIEADINAAISENRIRR